MATLSSIFDLNGVGVVTGGASGFGLNVASRLAVAGMNIALLDVSQAELDRAVKALNGQAQNSNNKVVGVNCNVTKFEECEAAARAVAAHFPGRPVSFLFVSSAPAADPPTPRCAE